MKRIGRWLGLTLALLVVGWMVWDLVFSDHGYLVYRSEKAELQQLKGEIADLKQRQKKLGAEILRLRNDPKALEELVHRELGYVYPDETMLILPERGDDSVRDSVKKGKK